MNRTRGFHMRRFPPSAGSVAPSTVDFSVASIGGGIVGVTDPGLSNPARYVWKDTNTSGTWRIKGTDCIFYCADGGGGGGFWVSVDDGAFVNIANDGTKLTAFSGLSDTTHLLRIHIDPGFGGGSAWTPTAGTLLSVTGVTPTAAVIGSVTSYCQDGAWPGKSMAYTESAPGGNWRPAFRRPSLSYADGRSLTGFTRRFKAKTLEIWVHTGEQHAMYSVDGGPMIEVDFTFTHQPLFFGQKCACMQLLATGLDLSADHEYKIVNQNFNDQQTYGTLDAIALVGTGAAFSAPSVKTILETFGTSITNGIHPTSNPYAGAQWFQYAGNTIGGVDVIGNGKSGVKAAAADIDLTAILADAGWIVPKRVLVELGANDGLTVPLDFQASLVSIYNQFRAAGVEKVAFEYVAPNDTGSYNAVNISIGLAVATIADAAHCRAIDTATWLGIASDDGLHPSLPGYITMGNYLMADATFAWLLT